MYKAESGSGVKAAQEQAKVAEFIRRNRISAWSVNKIKAGDFVRQTGTKMLLADIKSVVAAEIERQDIIRKARWAAKPTGNGWYKNRILHLLARKRNNVAEWEKMFSRAISLAAGLGGSYRATWSESPTLVRFGDNLLRVTWDEESDWEYYSKKYNRPKNTYSNRRVELLACGGLDAPVRVVNSYPVVRFGGNFLVDAIACFTGIKPINVNPALKPVQLNPFFQVGFIRQIGGVQIWSRTLVGEVVDFCTACNGTTYHAETVRASIAGLRNKLNTHAAREIEIIDYKYARDLGFCRSGIAQFCTDNGLDMDDSYTRAELRNIVVQKRTHNVQLYGAELRQLGITITM